MRAKGCEYVSGMNSIQVGREFKKLINEGYKYWYSLDFVGYDNS